MKVREERGLADRKLAKSGGQVDELLAACWEETLDPGPYVLAEDAKLDLGKVLQGDRFFALLMVRALTWPSTTSASASSSPRATSPRGPLATSSAIS